VTLRVWNQLGPTVGDAIRAAHPDIDVADIDPRPDLHPDGLGAPATVLYAQPLYGQTVDEIASVDTSWADGVEWVQFPSAGVDKVPPSLLRSRIATCGRGVMSGPIAEYVLAVLLAHRRGIPEVFVEEPPAALGKPDLLTLEGTTLGLVGFGAIAQAVAVRALPFGVEVLAARRSERPSEIDGVTIVPLPQLVARSDSLVVAAPATPATTALLDDVLLQSAKRGVHIVNIARGSLIDQDALLQALDDGIVGHATLDVTTPEPLPAGHPLYAHPRVSVSPHVSYSSPGIAQRGLERFLSNLARFRAGEPLEGLVDADAGY
jgi:phosphoglycerate dehydrogenase-like enzyme